MINRIIEVLAVVFNLLYTVLYLNHHPACYLFGVLGPLALMVLCFRSQLYAEPVLQLFYIGMSVYGFYNQTEDWEMGHWPLSGHMILIVVGLFISVLAGFFLSKYTKAKLPYPDSVVTVFAIAGTWLMVNYIHESWLYLLAINLISVVIYVKRQLYLGAAMFALYVLMSLDGYFALQIFYS